MMTEINWRKNQTSKLHQYQDPDQNTIFSMVPGRLGWKFHMYLSRTFHMENTTEQIM